MTRPTDERIAQARRRFETEADVWVATASGTGIPHLVPLSLTWDGTSIICVTQTANPTVRNIVATGKARASLESSSDVVIADTRATARDLGELTDDELDRFAAAAGWDPRDSETAWSVLTLTPETILSWQGEAEFEGRHLMRDGVWADREDHDRDGDAGRAPQTPGSPHAES
ncbi:MAG: pyridoxamine 5'-phosphate oxidase family protein [Acidimicrobiales bacterium]